MFYNFLDIPDWVRTPEVSLRGRAWQETDTRQRQGPGLLVRSGAWTAKKLENSLNERKQVKRNDRGDGCKGPLLPSTDPPMSQREGQGECDPQGPVGSQAERSRCYIFTVWVFVELIWFGAQEF